MVMSLAVMFTSCAQNNLSSLKIETKEDSLAYAIGVLNYDNLTQQGINVDAMKVAKGMIDTRDGKGLFNETVARGFLTVYMRDANDKKLMEQYKDVVEEGRAFLAENKTREGVQETESGLQYKVIKMGDGPKPTAEDKVRVNYTGKLLDGTVFDSSVERKEPIEFKLNGVIRGWTEGLQLMPVGSKFEFYIPYDLAYGSRGAGQDIKPFSTLIFEVELLDIIKDDK